MKKLLFLGGLNSGGAEHQMVVLATLLKKNGYNVTYLCDGNADFFQNKLDEAAIPIIRIRDNSFASLLKLNSLRIVLLLRGFLKRGNYDTIISFMGLWNFANCFYAHKKCTKHKAITGIRNNRDSVFLSSRELYYTRFEKYAAHIVSNSNSAKLVFGKYFPDLAEKLTTIYNIVDLPKIHSEYYVRQNDKVHIIVPASYRELKNPMGLLEALTLMDEGERNRLQIDWYGNIKGGQACYDRMRVFIMEKGLDDVIKLFDATTDIANRINKSDMVGLFSKTEGLPNSICEGMMLGKPVVMTRVSDFDVLVDQTNGFLCDWDNPQSIKEALSSVSKLSNDELLKMGRCSKIKAEALFSKEALMEQWKRII